MNDRRVATARAILENQLDPTSLPTDNLYKFIALAGLGLVGFSGWFYWKLAESQDRTMVQFQNFIEGYNDLSKMWDALRAEERKINAARLSVETALVRSGLTEAEHTVLESRLKSVERRESNVHERRGELDEQKRMLDDAKRATDELHRDNNRRLSLPVVIAVYAAGMVGVLVSIAGFALWYFRLQRYVDAQTMLTTETMNADLETKKHPQRTITTTTVTKEVFGGDETTDWADSPPVPSASAPAPSAAKPEQGLP